MIINNMYATSSMLPSTSSDLSKYQSLFFHFSYIEKLQSKAKEVIEKKRKSERCTWNADLWSVAKLSESPVSHTWNSINMSSFIININNYTFSSNTYIWDLGKWYWWTYLQGRHGGADVENRLVDIVGEGESEMNEESSINIYSLSGVSWIAGDKLLRNTGSPVWCSVMTWGWGKGGRIKREGIYVCSSSVAQSCSTLCDPMDQSTPGFPVLHCLPESAQTHVHWVGDAIQPPHPLSSPSPPAFNLSQHQGLFQWADSSHQVAKVLELQLQHQPFQWIFRVDFL